MTTRISVAHALVAFEVKFGTMPTAHELEIIDLMIELEKVAKEEFESTQPIASNPVLADVQAYHAERRAMNKPHSWAHVQRKFKHYAPHNPWGASADDVDMTERILKSLVENENLPTERPLDPKPWFLDGFKQPTCTSIRSQWAPDAFYAQDMAKYGIRLSSAQGVKEAPEGVSPQGG